MGFHSVDPVRFGSVSMVTSSLGTNDPEVGARCTYEGNDYLFVYNAGNSQISPGYGCIVSGVSGYSVTISSTVSLLVGVGIVKNATLTTGTYGWVLTRGFCQFEPGADVAKGEGLSLAGDGDFVNTSGITGPVYGKAMEAVTGAASGTGYFSF